MTIAINALFERNIYGPVKLGEHWRLRTNKEIQDTFQWEDNVKLITS
jgi:hypothetical protein